MWVSKLLILLNLHMVVSESCSPAKVCSACMRIDPACFWCPSSSSAISGCLKFNNVVIANILCPSLWVHNIDMCPVEDEHTESQATYKQPLQLDLLNSYHQLTDSVPSGDTRDFQVSQTQTKSSELKGLLHKLLILKFLRKIKNKDSSLTEEEKNLLYKLSSRQRSPTTTTTRKPPTVPADVNIKLSELLKILRNEAESELSASAVEQLEHEKALDKSERGEIASLESLVVMTTPRQATRVLPTTTKSITQHLPNAKVDTSNISMHTPNTQVAEHNLVNETPAVVKLHNRVEQGNVRYVEKVEETLEEWSRKKLTRKPLPHSYSVLNSSIKPTSEMHFVSTTTMATTTMATTTSIVDGNVFYCKLLEENDLCNSDHNCTWCNTLDRCIHRNNDDYQVCVKSADQMVDEQYGLDRCFKAKHCKGCVQDDKCYWCDVSQRCHTYPFFGYVPNSCSGDWYVKQCDVQLAVIIVVLPLIIILLGMVTFYFCLKYCHYRQKVLRVPLFEKPGIFDYRKDKKVYFVNPEDESSDDELAKEKMRKKYRLPIEKAPLIDPNT